MNHKAFRFAAIVTLSLGTLLAQGMGPGNRFGARNQPATPEQRHERRLDFMATFLGLTEPQKQQAQTIFDNAHGQAEALRALVQQAQEALHNAAKSNATPSTIDQLAADAGKLIGQMRAVHVKAFASFYQILTPEQREKLDKMPGLGMGPMGGGGFGGGFGVCVRN